KTFNDPEPYFRGMIAEIGLPHSEVLYTQQRRKAGKTKNNFFTLYELAMLGITSLSKVPLRIVNFTGFLGAAFCLLVVFLYLADKLLFWNSFNVGVAPLVIGFFLLGSLQMIFMGIIGEYVGNIHSLAQNRPLVFEEQRVNFEYPAALPQSNDHSAL